MKLLSKIFFKVVPNPVPPTPNYQLSYIHCFLFILVLVSCLTGKQ